MGSSKRAKRRRRAARDDQVRRISDIVRPVFRPFVDAAGQVVDVINRFGITMNQAAAGLATLTRPEWLTMDDRVVRAVRDRLGPMDPRQRKRMEYLRAVQREMMEREGVAVDTTELRDLNFEPLLPVVHQDFSMPVRFFGREEARVDYAAIERRMRVAALETEQAFLRNWQRSAPFLINLPADAGDSDQS